MLANQSGPSLAKLVTDMKAQPMRRYLLMLICSLICCQAFASEFYLLPDAGLAHDISADGSTVVGAATGQPWRWTPMDGLVQLDIPEGGTSSTAYDVSGDGLVVVGSVRIDDTSFPVSWSKDSAWSATRVELPDGVESGWIRLISSDASTYVFATSGDDVIVTPDETIHLAHPQDFTNDQPVGISADGTVVVGRRNTAGGPSEPYTWSASDGLRGLGRIDDASTSAWGVSSDGSVVFGAVDSDTWTWTKESSFVGLGQLPGKVNHRARAASADGSIVVGNALRHEPEVAFVWDDENGMRDLREVLEVEHGMEDLPRRLSRANAISDDGTTIAGYNVTNGNVRDAWVVQLDRPIVVTSGVAGDFNGNSVLDAEDLDLLALEIQSERDVALFDVNSDETVNFADREYWVGQLANTFFGDANLDKEVNFQDFLTLSVGFGQEGGWAEGDFDGDGQTKFEDFLMLSNSFGNSAVTVATSVPEPDSTFPLLIGIALLRYRNRHRTIHFREDEA